MYKIAKEKLPSLFAAVAAQMDLYLPVKKNGQVNYGIWSKEEEIALDALTTVTSPKDIFFPQSETLYNCCLEEKKLTIAPEAVNETPFALFGIRACDAEGLKVLDQVFLSDPIDTYYQARREHGILIAMACHQPEETCFCRVFGVKAQEPAGDIVTWMIDHTLFWEPKTEKGSELTERLIEHLSLAEYGAEEIVKKEQENIGNLVEKLPYSHLSLEVFRQEKLINLFQSPVWDELYKTCLGCGVCTFICPTCQCYDIQDYPSGNTIRRFRCWDSCMYSEFTLMAHGNIRNTQKERFRQRFMHKLVYFPENNNGMFSCVGCGRCMKKCPSHLNIIKVIKRLGVSEDV